MPFQSLTQNITHIMKQFIYNNYTLIIILGAVIAFAGIYTMNNYNTGFAAGFITGIAIGAVVGLLVTPKRKFLKEDQ